MLDDAQRGAAVGHDRDEAHADPPAVRGRSAGDDVLMSAVGRHASSGARGRAERQGPCAGPSPLEEDYVTDRVDSASSIPSTLPRTTIRASGRAPTRRSRSSWSTPRSARTPIARMRLRDTGDRVAPADGAAKLRRRSGSSRRCGPAPAALRVRARGRRPRPAEIEGSRRSRRPRPRWRLLGLPRPRHHAGRDRRDVSGRHRGVVPAAPGRLGSRRSRWGAGDHHRHGGRRASIATRAGAHARATTRPTPRRSCCPTRRPHRRLPRRARTAMGKTVLTATR